MPKPAFANRPASGMTLPVVSISGEVAEARAEVEVEAAGGDDRLGVLARAGA